MFGAQKRGLIRQELETIRFFSLFYFYLHPNASLNQQNNSTFLSIRESLRREKFYFGRFAKVYDREMQKFRVFSGSRKFLLAKVSAPKVYSRTENYSIELVILLKLLYLTSLCIIECKPFCWISSHL